MINMAGHLIKHTAYFNQLPAPAQTQVLNLAPQQGGPSNDVATLLTWVVFGLCLFLTVIGTVASFVVAGSTITSYQLWGLSFIIGVFLIGLTYSQSIQWRRHVYLLHLLMRAVTSYKGSYGRRLGLRSQRRLDFQALLLPPHLLRPDKAPPISLGY